MFFPIILLEYYKSIFPQRFFSNFSAFDTAVNIITSWFPTLDIFGHKRAIFSSMSQKHKL